MTFSLVGRCGKSGMVGGVVCSSSIAVASRCLWGGPHGMVLSQNVTDPGLGVLGTRLLARGYGAAGVLGHLIAAREYSHWRQLIVLDADGGRAHHTGARGLGVTAVSEGRDCIAGGNLLSGDGVPQAMTLAFDTLDGAPLAERLMAALEAGATAGGEAGPEHSAGLCVYGREDWPLANLRVDWSDDPVEDLRALWERYAPQMQDYYVRAKNPEQAPSYGVPGDL